MNLKQMIKNECEKDNQLAAKLSKIAGMVFTNSSTPQRKKWTT